MPFRISFIRETRFFRSLGLTDEEMTAAYHAAQNWVLAHLKALASARFAPIEETRFSPARGNAIGVRTYVDAQNSFGEF